MGFVSFVANLLNGPTDGEWSASEKEFFSSACEYVKLPFSLRVLTKSFVSCLVIQNSTMFVFLTSDAM
jgi:hypothetical protein